MAKRVITALVSLAVFFAVVIPENKIVFDTAVALIAAAMLWEMFSVTRIPKRLWAAGYISAALMGYGLYTGTAEITGVITMMMFLIITVFLHGERKFKDVYTTAFVSYYIVFFMITLVWCMDRYGVFWLMLPFLCAWTTDTGAFFCGRAFGKHKLIPKVSPKKTVEGSVGGIIVCIVCVYLYILIVDAVFGAGIMGTCPVWVFGAIALLGSCAAQLGDLAASAVKRDCGVKDFGTIMPGHGGILDRFDSVLLSAPLVYYLIVFATSVVGR